MVKWRERNYILLKQVYRHSARANAFCLLIAPRSEHRKFSIKPHAATDKKCSSVIYLTSSTAEKPWKLRKGKSWPSSQSLAMQINCDTCGYGAGDWFTFFLRKVTVVRDSLTAVDFVEDVREIVDVFLAWRQHARTRGHVLRGVVKHGRWTCLENGCLVPLAHSHVIGADFSCVFLAIIGVPLWVNEYAWLAVNCVKHASPRDPETELRTHQKRENYWRRRLAEWCEMIQLYWGGCCLGRFPPSRWHQSLWCHWGSSGVACTLRSDNIVRALG